MVIILEDVENGQNLSVVRDESLADHIGRTYQVLKDFQGGAHDFAVSRIQSFLDRDDQLWNNGQGLAGTMLKHIMHSLSGEKFMRVRRFRESLEKQRKIVMVVELLDFNLPCDLVALRVVFQSDRKVAPFITLPKFCRLWCSLLKCPCDWCLFDLRSEELMSKDSFFSKSK